MMHAPRWFAACALTAMLGLVPAVTNAQEPPAAGNTCNTAGVITESGIYPYSTIGASPNDPCYFGVPRTVWFRFVAPSDGFVDADMCDSNFDTYLTVFEGAECPTACAGVVAENDDECGEQSAVAFSVVEGQTYHFALSGYSEFTFGSGDFNFTFTPQAFGEGLNCEEPVLIIDNGDYHFDTEGANPVEPCSFGSSAPTIWYRFDVPAYGVVNATTCAGGLAGFDNTIVAYITDGSCPVDCSSVVQGQDQCGIEPSEFGVSFPVNPGTTVYFTVSGFLPTDFGVGTLTFSFEPTAAGDTCAEAGVISGDGAYQFDSTGASADDPCVPNLPTVWYVYPATQYGRVSADLCGTSFDSFLMILAGAECPASCTMIVTLSDNSCGNDAAVEFDVVPGTNYYFAINGFGISGFGPGALNFSFSPFEAADSCVDALEIPGNGFFPYTTVGASTDDPCETSSPTVWYSFTAAQSGSLLVSTCGLTDYDTFLRAYAGGCPAACEDDVAFNDDFCEAESFIEFEVTAGTQYMIAVSGYSDSAGSGSVYIQFTPSGASELGDINGDGVVNVADVTALANLIAAGNPPSNAIGDINNDSTVDSLDVEALSALIVGNQ